MVKSQSEKFEGRSSAMRLNTIWLSSEDLLDVGDCKVVIEACYHHKNPQFEAGRKVPECFALKFVGKEKQLVLNATNRKSLVAMFGTNVKNWTGKQITLYVKSDVAAFGELVNGIRIRLVRNKPNLSQQKTESQPPEPPQPEPPKQETAPTQPEGEVSSTDVGSLKKLWFAKYGEEFKDNKAAAADGFKAWVGVATQREFDTNDAANWTKDDLGSCVKRLNPTPEPTAETQPDEIPFGDDNDTGVI